MIAQQSAKALCAYAYASAGVGESTTDLSLPAHAQWRKTARSSQTAPAFY